MINTYKPEGMILATLQNRELISSRGGLEKALAGGYILESTALLCDKDMNLHIDLHGIEGIMPRDEVYYCREDEEIKDIAIITRVGKPICFKVIGIEEKEGKIRALLSRRLAQIECRNNYISTLFPGDIIDARVTHLETFGAFADIGCGIVALLAVDCISVSRFSHPRDRLYSGMVIHTVVKAIDKEKDRIFISTRELLGTWEENAARFSQGQTVAGIIRSVENYGIFVELAPNLAGLAELREGSLSPADSLVGRTAAVYIKSIIPERMKIKLVLVDSYKSEQVLPKLDYFVDCNKLSHMDRWEYSPATCLKRVETVFE